MDIESISENLVQISLARYQFDLRIVFFHEICQITKSLKKQRARLRQQASLKKLFKYNS